MNIVVLGGHGFLGQHLCRALGTHPQHRVIALSRQDGLDLRAFSPLPSACKTSNQQSFSTAPRMSAVCTMCRRASGRGP